MSWYKKFARDLPWRRTKNPYYIWLSEVMLQQTQVKTVIPYYKKFIQAFPTVQDLAQSSEDKLMQYWQGLGYYRRAKYLRLAAQEIVADYGGKLPETAENLIKLKGFGEYTSASVASIAFGEKIACVDGNVKRVMARLFADDANPGEKSQSLLYEDNPSHYNQAIMELGATICTPKNPQCLLCPVQKSCTALKKGSVELFPKKAKKIKQKNLYTAIVLIEKDGYFLMEKRTQPGRWENLWQNPNIERLKTISESEILSWIQNYTNDSSLKLEHLGNFNHKLTHQNIHAQVFYTKTPKNVNNELKDPNQKWVNIKKSSDLGISIFQKKALKLYSNNYEN